MARITIIGASGQVATQAIDLFLNDTDDALTLVARHTQNLQDLPSNRVKVIEADATDEGAMKQAVKGADEVFVASAGENLGQQAETIIDAMKAENVSRLVFVTTLGIYDEVPGKFGEWNNKMIGPYLPPYQAAAKAIESSGLDYTILRPAWLTNKDEIDFETTQKGEPFKGTEVSRRSVADVAVQIAQDPSKYSKESIGVNKPGTDGDKPAWM